MAKKIRELDLFGQRDFSLALLQIGLDAESGPLPYLDNAELTKPYFVGERRGDVVACFIDTTQVEWQKREIYKKLESDPTFMPNLLKISGEHFEKVEAFLKGGVIPKDELKQFFDGISTIWRWWAGWWWAVEALEEQGTHQNVLEEIMAFRRKTERVIPIADEMTVATIQALHPTIGKYASVVLTQELLNDQIPNETLLKKRFEHCLLIGDEVFVDEDIEKELEQLGIELVMPQPTHPNGLLTGQVAYKGTYTGKVSIVLTKEHANNFRKGDVLVASQTTPDFIHAIKKAGAIVADEGGIISHAAISAREFKIPCIIGTKFGTQVLKDGDLVEVDADKGIVRILK